MTTRVHKMEIQKFKFSILILSLFFVSSESSAKIQLYNGANYSNIIAEVIPTSGCHNLQSDKIGLVHSVITGTCFIAYNGYNCKAAWSRKYNPGKTSHNDYIYAKSVQICDDQEGGPQLNIDITKYFHNKDPPVIPNLLESYHDICACFNIPKYIQDRHKWSIDNHHNGLFAYFEPDCTEKYSKAFYIDAGHNTNSRNMHTHKKTHKGTTMKIQAFGPDPNTTHFQQSCTAYPKDQIMKFELLEDLNHIKHTGAVVIPNKILTNLTTGANDDLMHFFADYNYQGFHFGSRSASKCNKFTKPVQQRWINGIRSIITKTCVMLYLTDDCTGRSVKIVAPGSNNLTYTWESTVTGSRTLSLLYTQFSGWKWETKSYHVCNKDRGGPNLNVDIVSSDPKVDPVNGAVLLERYRNLCSCRNVPQYVKQLWLWSVDNYGNSMVAYFTPDCLSSSLSPIRIPAGQSSYSFGLGFFEKVEERTGIIHKIQSFGPDLNSDYYIKNCNRSKLISENKCDMETNAQNTQMALLTTERMLALEAKLQMLIEGFHTLVKKVDQLDN